MTAALEGGEWSAARPGRTLPPGKTRYQLYKRLVGPQGRSGRAENLVPTGIRSRTVQPVAQSLYRLSYRTHLPNNLLSTNIYEHSYKLRYYVELLRDKLFKWDRLLTWDSLTGCKLQRNSPSNTRKRIRVFFTRREICSLANQFYVTDF